MGTGERAASVSLSQSMSACRASQPQHLPGAHPQNLFFAVLNMHLGQRRRNGRFDSICRGLEQDPQGRHFSCLHSCLPDGNCCRQFIASQGFIAATSAASLQAFRSAAAAPSRPARPRWTRPAPKVCQDLRREWKLQVPDH